MDIVGLVLSAAAMWETCVQVFEVINLTLEYGMDYEVLSVKLEVERVRLLLWGQAVGLNDVPNNADIRLKRTEIHSAVIRLLGCIQHVFEDSERLQNAYGLRPSLGAPEGVFTAAATQPSQSRQILGGVFKLAYEILRRAARERQRNTSVIRKSKWAIHDRKKFMVLVAEIRGFNDSLESLFPDAKLRMTEAMRRDIDEANQVRDLQLLQEATAGEQGLEDISDRASIRLEALGASVSARTELLSDLQSETSVTEDKEGDRNESETVQDADEEILRNDQLEGEGGLTATGDQELDELSKRLRDIELYVQKKSTGALTLSRSGPFGSLSHCSADVYWDGNKSDHDRWSPWADKDKGFVPMPHASFDLYKKKKYMKKFGRDKYESPDSEDYVLLDPESHIKFENVNPGTVTVEGYGLECWEFESQKPREHTIFVNRSKLPDLEARRLLRRIDELQTGSDKFGWNPDKEELDLKQFVGTLGITYYNSAYERDKKHWIGDLYSVLNRTGIFVDITGQSSLGIQWTMHARDGSIGIWNFLRQMVVAWELAMRLKHLGDDGYTGFTPRILASLIVSDLWLKHVKIILTDAPVPIDWKKAETPMEKAKAEESKRMGDEALKRNQYKVASDLYTEAIRIDLMNAVYRFNRAAARLGLGNWQNAEEDAYIATKLDPKHANAWSRLGMTRLKRGQGKRAKKAYEKALEVAGKDATPAMRQGLADAQAKIDETVNAIRAETDVAKQHAMISDLADEDFEILGRIPEFHSLIHEQQVEGLLLFAERMKWPYINEVRDYAEDIYSELRGGKIFNVNLLDWLYGVVLPGKWFAYKIMTALILCTLSIRDTVRIAHYYDCGFSLPTRSYWRCRTVLGRVLGCLPGVQGLCGWIGPCPPVEFDPLPGNPQRPRHIRISARRISPFDHKPDINDRDRVYDWDDRNEATHIQPEEEINPYIADMKDSSKWIVPEPPVRDISTCQIKSIKLRKIPLDVKFASRNMEEPEIENETEYRASLEFTLDDNPTRPVTYKLLTNPVFVTLPPCRPGPKGPHEVHMRELPRYQKNIWSVQQLKDHTYGDGSDSKNKGVMIINATAEGSEVLARAWCSERGMNAVIRRAGGACFVCAVRAAGKGGLGLGVLIWVA